MDGPLEITTTVTAQDRIEAALWATHVAQPGRRRRNLIWSLALILGGSAVGLLAGWADGPDSLAEFLSLAPAILRTPYTVLMGILLAIAVVRYVFDDRFLRRRAARWVLTEQGGEAVTFLYRVDASGLTVEDATGDIHVSGLTGVDETPGAFYIRYGGGLVSTLTLPKHGIVPALQDRFRAALSSMVGTAPGPARPAWPSVPGASAEVVLRYDQTREDLAAALWEMWNTPAARRQRALTAFVLAIVLVFAVPAFASLDWLLDPSPDALTTLVAQAREEFGKGVLVAVAIGVGAWSLTRRLIRKQALALATAQAGAGQPARFELGPDGFVLEVSNSVMRYDWRTVRGYREGADHLFLMLRYGQVVALPRRAFDADALATTRRLVAEHLPGAHPGASA